MPDAGGRIRGIALSGKAGETLERIKREQDDWPAYLRDDAPFKQCDACKRKSWSSECRVGTSCGMPQPDGPSCEGHFIDPLTPSE